MRQPNPQQNQKPYTQQDKGDVDSFGLKALRAAANGVLPIFRYRPGDRYHRNSIISLAGQACLMGHSPLMIFYTPIWFLFLLAGGVDKHQHSLWGGSSRLGMFGEQAARFIEPWPVLAAGVLCLAVDEVFGLFLLASGTAALMLAIYEWQQVNLYRRTMRDREREMGWMSDMRRRGF